MSEKTEEVATYVDPETKQQIRMAAAADGVGMSQWVRDLILEELERREEEGNPSPGVVAIAQTAD